MYVLIYSDNYDNITITNCTENENNFDIKVPTSLITIPSGLSLLCLLSLMIDTMIKPLKTNK